MEKQKIRFCWDEEETPDHLLCERSPDPSNVFRVQIRTFHS